MDRNKLLELTNMAIELLGLLEAALDAGDQRKVGARLYELGRQLNAIRDEIERKSKYHS